MRLTVLNGGGWNNPVTLWGRQRIVTEDLGMNSVSPEFFASFGIPILHGRNFDARDDGPHATAIVNDELVRRYFHGEDPLGAKLGIGDGPDAAPDTEIVGVVRSFHDVGLRDPEPEVFFPLWGGRAGAGTFYLRTRGTPASSLNAVRETVRRIDPGLTVLHLHPVDAQIDRLLTSERMLAALSGAFAAVATLLAAIGLYGVLSFAAACRTREIGIRLALGARPWSASGIVFREAALLAALGLAIALPAAWALGRFIESQLFGVHPMDLPTFAGAAGVLLAVCLLASLGPAQRVRAVSPLETLRGE